MIDYSFGYETNDGHHGLGVSEAAPPAAFTARRHDTENQNAYDEIVYMPERTCRNVASGEAAVGTFDVGGVFRCSECGFAYRFSEMPHPFCPDCGAKVVE